MADLFSGKILAERSAPNLLKAYGADVVRRLGHAMAPEKAKEMSTALRKGLESLTGEMALETGLSAEGIVEIVAVGNSAMQALFWELPVSGLARSPFEPAGTASKTAPCGDLGMTGLGSAFLYWPPLIGGYVGSDALCALDAAETLEGINPPFLLIDTGTNSEVLLAAGGRVLCASAAAGPALEGGNLACGVSAGKGAIHSFRFAGGLLHPLVMGQSKPVGVCGSGIVDLVALLLEAGAIAPSGLLCPGSSPALFHDRCGKQGGVRTFDFFPGLPPLTQTDIRSLQLAKGAIAAAAALLLEQAGLTPPDLNGLLLAGAFGTALDPENAARIGLVPRTPAPARGIGNAALDGATLCLIAPGEARERHGKILERTVHVPLHADQRFQERFIASLALAPWP